MKLHVKKTQLKALSKNTVLPLENTPQVAGGKVAEHAPAAISRDVYSRCCAFSVEASCNGAHSCVC